MGSQIVAVRSAMVAALATLPAYTTTGPTGQKPEVLFGWKDNWKRREKVWTQRARFTHEPASIRAGKTFAKETGEFDLMIFVHGVGLTQAVTSGRVADLASDAWDWVQTHANWQDDALVSGAKIHEFLIVGDGEIPEGVDSSGNPMAQMTLPVRYRARLE